MKILIAIVGAVNLFFMAFHIVLYWGMAHFPGVSESVRIGMYSFNTAVVLLTAFLGFIFLTRRDEVMTTGLGAAALVFGALIYLTRIARAVIWPSHDWAVLAVCAVAGILHLVVLSGVRVRRAP